MSDLKRYKVKVLTGPTHNEWTYLSMESSSDDAARRFMAKLGEMLTAGEYEMTVEDVRTVNPRGETPETP